MVLKWLNQSENLYKYVYYWDSNLYHTGQMAAQSKILFGSYQVHSHTHASWSQYFPYGIRSESKKMNLQSFRAVNLVETWMKAIYQRWVWCSIENP